MRKFCTLMACVMLFAVPLAGRAAPAPTPTPAEYRRLADEMDASLQNDVLAKWYPAALDTAGGGFFQNFREDWTRDSGNDKSVVYQARLTWVAAEAARRNPAHAAPYLAAARHGVAFLENTLWDKQNGGFFWAMDSGPPSGPDRDGEKHVYGISFAIYAAAAAFRVTHDADALRLAQQAFGWLDTHAHDPKNGGYYEALTQAGQPILAPSATPAALTNDQIGTAYGYKSMNTHIHLLESFTALYAVWPDKHLKARLSEVFGLVRDRIAVQPGCLNLYFTPQWRPVPDVDSFGHDVETAYLLTEAADALGKPNDPKTWAVARSLVDHALAFGWDAAHGGFYDQGRALGLVVFTDKIWWEQAEGLNALLLMHTRYGQTDPRYWQEFLRQWQFIRTYQIDPVHGGWYPKVSDAGVAAPGQAKSDAWTEAYHQGRALMNVSAALRRLAKEDAK